jgi:hypothetical protein
MNKHRGWFRYYPSASRPITHPHRQQEFTTLFRRNPLTTSSYLEIMLTKEYPILILSFCWGSSLGILSVGYWYYPLVDRGHMK